MTLQDVTAGMRAVRPARPPSAISDAHRNAVDCYHFPEHVHYTVVQDSVIFMDLRADQYSLLTGEKARLFATLFMPAPGAIERALLVDPSNPGANTGARSALLTELLNGHLLARGVDPTPMTRQSLPLPCEDFLAAGNTDLPRVRLRHVRRFLTACLVSAWRLRHRSIEDTVRAVERRRRFRTPEHPPDLSELRRVVALFHRMRPLFPKDALCLFDSLALLEFLARYGCFPHWVFAVTLNPWSAHCWVQYADVALNEDAERARHYTVILVA